MRLDPTSNVCKQAKSIPECYLQNGDTFSDDDDDDDNQYVDDDDDEEENKTQDNEHP